MKLDKNLKKPKNGPKPVQRIDSEELPETPSLAIPDCPVVPNPVLELRLQMDKILTLPSLSKFTPVTSKCGLGKTQGTKGTARGIEFDSYWEFAWYIYQTDIKGNIVNRNTTECFNYTDENGVAARFFPDFKMGGCFHEVKGIFRPNDLLKQDATLGIVTFWGPKEMKPIIKKVYEYNPDWKTEYMEIAHQTRYSGKNYF